MPNRQASEASLPHDDYSLTLVHKIRISWIDQTEVVDDLHQSIGVRISSYMLRRDSKKKWFILEFVV